jgi:adenylosuccinate synthase
LIIAVLVCFLAGLGSALTGCGSSNKDKAMAVADKFEALVDEYIVKIKEKKDAKDKAGLKKVMKEFQQKSMKLSEEITALQGNMSEKEQKEVEKRFDQIFKKMTKMYQM